MRFRTAVLTLIIGCWAGAALAANYDVQVELENTSGEKKTDWPVILTVCRVFGRDLPAGSINPKGYHVYDQDGTEIAYTVEEIPPYDVPGNNELVFLIAAIDPGRTLTYRITNTDKDSAMQTAPTGKLDFVNSPHNLLKNPGFEDGDDKAIPGWTVRGGVARDKDVKHSGGASLRLRSDRRLAVNCTEKIALHPGSLYYFGAWGKTDNVSRHGYATSRGGHFTIAGLDNGFRSREYEASKEDKYIKRLAETRIATIATQCATRDWAKMRFEIHNYSDWGIPESCAKATAETATLAAELDQRRQFFMKNVEVKTKPDGTKEISESWGKTEGTWWLDDLTLFEQPKVTVRFDKTLEPLMKDGLFFFTLPSQVPLGNHYQRGNEFCALPQAHEALDRFDRYGLRGQWVPYEFGVYTKKELKDLRVEVRGGAVAGPAGAAIPVEGLEFARGFLNQKDDHPHVLEALAAPVTIDGPPRLPYFVVTFFVPRDAKPGKYETTITVSAEGKALREIPLTLRVQDLEMPVLRDLYVGMIFMGGKPPFNDAGLKQYSRSGFSCLTRFGGFLKYIKNAKGEPEIDMVDFAQKMEWLLKYNITAGVAPFSDFDLGPLWNGGSLYQKTKGNKELWQREVKRLEDARKQHPNWPRVIYMTWDEPIPGTPRAYGSHGGPHPSMGWVLEACPDALTNIDAQLFCFDQILQYYNMPDFDDPADFCGPELYSYLKKLGKDYGFAASAARGEIARYQPGMMMIASGAKYMHAWQLSNNWSRLMDQTEKNGPVLRSTAMVAAGEGMDDLKVHRLLTDAMAAAQNSTDPKVKKALADAEAYLKRIHTVWNADHAHASGVPYLGTAHSWGYDRFFGDWQEQMARYAAALRGVAWIE